MSDQTGIRKRQFAVDILLLGIGGVILLILLVAVSPTRRGFFCGDESIRYPFHPSTVPNYVLYIFGFSIPFAVIIATEVIQNHKARSSVHFIWRPVPLWVACVYRSLVDFLFGCVASQLVTDMGKYTIGRLRPNFIDVCGPVFAGGKKDCSAFGHEYITDYTCERSEEDARESRVSFPSGHSSFSAYTMLYVAIFVQVKIVLNQRSSLRLVKHGFQLAAILLTCYTALSRVMDNKHHWSDVLAGGLVGAVTASLVARYVSGLLDGTKSFRAKPFDDLTTALPPQNTDIADIEAGRRSAKSTNEQSVAHIYNQSD